MGVVATMHLASASKRAYGIGIGSAWYMQRGRADRELEASRRCAETLRFRDHCHRLGAGGIQAPLASLDEAYAARVRERAEAYGMYVEVSARLPTDRADLTQFEETVRAARTAGASVIRTVMLSGRRYETFRTLESWKDFAHQSWKSLTLAEPVLARNGMRISRSRTTRTGEPTNC